MQSILIMPGIGMSADSWFTSPEFGTPMPIQLYEAGYDVWLGNNRGTTHSQGHQKLSINLLLLGKIFLDFLNEVLENFP